MNSYIHQLKWIFWTNLCIYRTTLDPHIDHINLQKEKLKTIKANFNQTHHWDTKQKEDKTTILTWIMPLIRQTPWVYITMCESSGWSALTSFLTSSTPTLWSVDNRSATTGLLARPSDSRRPRTALESPRLATYKTSFEIAPRRQHEPTEAICGRAGHDRLTKCKNPSSVASNALLITSSDNPPCSVANSEGNQ